jgi:hypothetical protein
MSARARGGTIAGFGGLGFQSRSPVTTTVGSTAATVTTSAVRARIVEQAKEQEQLAQRLADLGNED